MLYALSTNSTPPPLKEKRKINEFKPFNTTNFRKSWRIRFITASSEEWNFALVMTYHLESLLAATKAWNFQLRPASTALQWGDNWLQFSLNYCSSRSLLAFAESDSLKETEEICRAFSRKRQGSHVAGYWLELFCTVVDNHVFSIIGLERNFE